ncbi:MAG: hypothetical protein MH321_07650 [Leptospiraceae bacterium]|nr:hypothetical protein [Leptospiraceae bacterium]
MLTAVKFSAVTTGYWLVQVCATHADEVPPGQSKANCRIALLRVLSFLSEHEEKKNTVVIIDRIKTILIRTELP